MAEETVKVPVTLLEELKGRLAYLELAQKQNEERERSRDAKIIDKEYEAWKAQVSRPASVRTQEIADKKFPDGKPFQCCMDNTTDEGKPGPKIVEHFPLVVRANSDYEAIGRYEELMGLSPKGKREYTVKAEPVGV